MIRPMPRHFSEIIRDQFHDRALKNPSYSLRAFARDLELTSGTLSDILSKKVGISLLKAQSVAEKLGLVDDDRDFFCKLTEANCARKKEDREKAEKELLKYDTSYINLSDDVYHIIADWYHFALVELVRVRDFEFNYDWMAKRLNISVEETEAAISRLLRVELLEIQEGKLLQTYDYFISPSGTPSDAAKKFHQQLLVKASHALETQVIEERNFTSGFLRTRTSDLPLIAAKIKEFRRELAKEVEDGEGHDSVYAFSIQFFRGDDGDLLQS